MSILPQPLLDLTELRDSARLVLAKNTERAASAAESWRTIASLGWLGISVAADRGGLEIDDAGPPWTGSLWQPKQIAGEEVAVHETTRAAFHMLQNRIERCGDLGLDRGRCRFAMHRRPPPV